MHRDYLLLINDYFLTLKKDIRFDIVLPFVLAIISIATIHFGILAFDKLFLTNVLTVLGIIAGFSVTAITLLTSSSTKSIEKLKTKMTDSVLDGMQVSAFRRFYILISYSVFISFFVILLNVIGLQINWFRFTNSTVISIIKGVDLFLIYHIFFINFRNISSLYYIYFNETNADNSN